MQGVLESGCGKVQNVWVPQGYLELSCLEVLGVAMRPVLVSIQFLCFHFPFPQNATETREIFLVKLISGRDGPVKSMETTKAGMKAHKKLPYYEMIA